MQDTSKRKPITADVVKAYRHSESGHDIFNNYEQTGQESPFKP